MNLIEMKDKSMVEEHERFLKELKNIDDSWKIQDTGCFYKYDKIKEKLDFIETSKELYAGKYTIYFICVNGIIVYIGKAKRFSDRGKNYAKGGTVDHIGKNGQKVAGNPTYNRINSNLMNIGPSISETVKIFFISIEHYDEKDSSQIRDLIKDKFMSTFGKLPKWNEIEGNNKSYYKKVKKVLQNENIKETFERYLREDREEEIKSNGGYYENNRSYDVKKAALKAAQDKCFFENIFGCKENYFFRKNIIVDENRNYLEVHHILPIAMEKIERCGLKNLDTVENTVCLCGNCHNRLHYGDKEVVEEMLEFLYTEKIKKLENHTLDIGLENLKEIYLEYKW